MIGFGNSWTRGRPIEKCVHNFMPTKVFFMGACVVCFKNFGVSCVKCNGGFFLNLLKLTCFRRPLIFVVNDIGKTLSVLRIYTFLVQNVVARCTTSAN